MHASFARTDVGFKDCPEWVNSFQLPSTSLLLGVFTLVLACVAEALGVEWSSANVAIVVGDPDALFAATFSKALLVVAADFTKSD